MKQKIQILAMLLIALYANSIYSQGKYPELDIPHTKVVLSNGLTVIVHEDHKTPIIATNIWYHVGSKNEKAGKTGFAHLFEHLMFNGSENYNKDYFQAMDRIGATNLNGTTNNDRTNYFQNFPVGALDQVLFLESDRMGHLIGAIDQAKLDEQRGVVQNEKRQGENEPYSISEELIIKATYPAGHPYSWSVIGSMEDLNAASLSDVKEWFKTYYGAANAVIVIAGDIKTDEAIAKVKQYFGDIPSGPPVAHHSSWIAKRTGTQRQVAQDRVPQTQINYVWNVPGAGDVETDQLDVLAAILGGGKTSRLYKRLVYKDQLCSSISAGNNTNEIAGQFYVEANVKPGVDASKVDEIINEEIQKLLKEGVTAQEVELVQTQTYSFFVKGLERIGGFGGKSDILASSTVYLKDPNGWKTSLKTTLTCTASDIKNVANKWISDGVYILTINPFPDYTTAEKGVDRSKLPEIGANAPVKFADFKKATLSNGLKIILAERKNIPTVQMNLMFKAGFSADKLTIPGVADLTANMLDEGAKNMNALEISEKLNSLGAGVGSSASLDYNNLSLSALTSTLDQAMEIYANILLEPTFPQADFDRIKKQQVNRIASEKNSPYSMALRVLPKYLFGEDHPYGNPLTGSGTEADLTKIKLEDLKKFYATWYKPNNATMVIVGDISLEKAKEKLEKLFANWKKADVPSVKLPNVAQYQKETLYIMDKPGAAQSLIFAGHLLPAKTTVDENVLSCMNDIFGGDFTSRLNMNLREDKHWSYGVGTMIFNTAAQRPYLVYAPVQTDKTKESIAEIKKEFNKFLVEKVATTEEVDKVKKNNKLQLNGLWETNGAVAGSLSEMVRFNYKDDYFDKLSAQLDAVNSEAVVKIAQDQIKPDQMVWVVIGDRAKIEEGVKSLGFKQVKFIDTDGKEIK